MGKYLKILVLAILCLSLLVVMGCKKEDPAAATTTGTTTVPQETTEGTEPEETTEKPVNIVEDPLNNGEGDPTDAMGTTDPSEADKPNVDIEVDEDDSGSTGNTGSTAPKPVTGPATDVYGPLKTGTDYNIRLTGKGLFFTGTAADNMFNAGAQGDAVKLQIEKVEGKGIKLYFMKDNVKTYLEIKSGGICALSTSGSVFAYNASQVYVAAVGGTNYYLALNSAGTSIIAAAEGSNATAVEFIVAETVNTNTGDTDNGKDEDDFVIDFDDLT